MTAVSRGGPAESSGGGQRLVSREAAVPGGQWVPAFAGMTDPET